uniref:Uncharacterized protein n=1 Tax=Romanomermis culicivorax TaxID=13658 RepID=A0A915IBT8_ROMCU
MDVNLPVLFSDHVEFRAKFQQYWDSVRAENLDFLSVFYTLTGYLSTMKTNEIYDQISRDHLDILKVLVAGHRDRFYLLFIARHSVSKSLTGRLFYFHMNQQAQFFDGNFLSLDDLDFILDSLRNYDPSISEMEQGLWMQKIRENCLFVGVRAIRPTIQNPNIQFKVDTYLIRIDQMFQPRLLGVIKFRELSTSNCDLSHVNSDHLYTTFEMLYDAFRKNSGSEGTSKLVFYFNKQNFLGFVRGALFFNVENLEITPMYVGERLEKLAILIRDQKRWITDQEPIFVEVYISSEENLESGFDADIRNLPVGFGTSAKKAVVVSVVVSQGNILNIGISKVDIVHSTNGLIDFLGKLTTLEVDNFNRNKDYFRKEFLLHLDRIDTFLGHQHKVRVLRHYILCLLMSMDNDFTAYKLTNTFDATNPADAFLIRSGDNGFVITLSPDIVNLHVSDFLADRILETGLRKLIIVSINDGMYSVKSRDGETINPMIGMLSNDAEFSPFFHTSHWSLIQTKFGPNMLSKILLTRENQAIRFDKWKRQLEVHLMIPKNRAELSAQLKAMIPEKICKKMIEMIL